MTRQKKFLSVIRQRARQLRQPLTPPEACLWKIVRGRRLGGYKFRRQHPIGRYIVDFYCPAARLVVELDGPPHEDQVEYDAVRTEWLEARGYHVLRFRNQELLEHEEAVVRTILMKCKALAPSPWGGSSGRER